MRQYLNRVQRKVSRVIHHTRRNWAIPSLRGFHDKTGDLRAELAPAHETYVTSVSTPKMAASLEVSVLLYHLCRVKRPDSILDLGSGFSSFVLRRYANKTDEASVISVDDHAGWLSKTEEYLAEHGLPTDRLVEFADFDFGEHRGEFDLIFHDLGSMEVRKETLKSVISVLSKDDGLVVLDDYHKGHYVNYVGEVLSDRNYEIYKLDDITLDQFGRYSALARYTD
jgi:predicted O-methyltransferase YrrM